MSGNLKPSLILEQLLSFRGWRLLLLGMLTSGVIHFDLGGLLNASFSPTSTSGSFNAAQAAEVLNRPILKSGSMGSDVQELQATLKLLGFYSGAVDGVYGETTQIAVSQFQQAAGLPSDGITGPATWNRLFPPTPTTVTSSSSASGKTPPRPNSSTAPPSTSTKPKPATPAQPSPATTKPATSKPAPTETTSTTPSEPTPFPVLKLGMKGPAVTGLQYRLRAIGVLKGEADGVFGPETQEAVKAAQRKFNLNPDGVVGPATWAGLLQ